MENEKYKFVYEKAFKTNGINDDPVLISEGYYEYYRDSNLVDGYFSLWPGNKDGTETHNSYGNGADVPNVTIKKMARARSIIDAAISFYLPGAEYVITLTTMTFSYLKLEVTYKGLFTNIKEFERATGMDLVKIQSSKAGVILEYTAEYI